MKRFRLYARIRRCSWTAGWNEIMLLFEIANPVFERYTACLDGNDFQGEGKKRSFRSANLLHFPPLDR